MGCGRRQAMFPTLSLSQTSLCFSIIACSEGSSLLLTAAEEAINAALYMNYSCGKLGRQLFVTILIKD